MLSGVRTMLSQWVSKKNRVSPIDKMTADRDKIEASKRLQALVIHAEARTGRPISELLGDDYYGSE